MSLGRILYRGAKEKAQEMAAKRKLEQKLGRPVSDEELYSLGAHMDAAGDINPAQPLISSQRESSVPFADAKPPMKLTVKLLMILIPLFFVCVIGVALVFMTMSERTYNRLNPFTPKPPAGIFAQNFGDFALAQSPDYSKPSSFRPQPSYEGEYKRGDKSVHYTLLIYSSESEVASAFTKAKENAKSNEWGKVIENSDSRVFVASLAGWTSYIYFKDGVYLKKIDSYDQKAALDFEGFVKNQPPQPVTLLNAAEMKETSLNSNGPLSVSEILNDFKKDSNAAEKKYKDKNVNLSGTVEVSQRDKGGQWTMGFLRPGSTKPQDGMIVVTFDKDKESNVTSIKKGDSVNLQCKYSMNLYISIVFEHCSKL